MIKHLPAARRECQILDALDTEVLTVAELARRVGISSVRAAQFLTRLRKAGLVDYKSVWYVCEASFLLKGKP